MPVLVEIVQGVYALGSRSDATVLSIAYRAGLECLLWLLSGEPEKRAIDRTISHEYRHFY